MTSWTRIALLVAGLLVAGGAAWMLTQGAEGPDAEGAVVTPRLQAESEGEVALPSPAAGRTAETQAQPLAAPHDSTPIAPDPGAALAAGSQKEPLPTAAITGRVVDASDRPIAGAEVSFLSQAADLGLSFRGRDDDLPAVPKTVTDRDGRFALTAEVDPRADDRRFPGLADQDRLIARHSDFASVSHDCPSVEPGLYDAGVIMMPPGGRVRGRAVDANGRPLAGVEVRARNLPEDGEGRVLFEMISSGVVQAFDAVTTGPDGRFQVGGLGVGRAELTASRDDLRLAVLDDLEVVAGVPLDVGDVALEAGASIAGRVVDDQGNPVPGVTIRVSSMARILVNRMEDAPRSTIGHEFGLRAETDARGSFVISGLGDGAYTVHASATGWQAAREEDVPTGTQDLVLTTTRLGGLLVKVVSDRDGAAVPGAKIGAQATSSEGGFRFAFEPLTVVEGPAIPASEAGQGKAALWDPLARPCPEHGTYLVLGAGLEGTDLTVEGAGFAVAELQAPAVPPGRIVDFEVRLVPESILAGRVLDDQGAGIAGAGVRLEPREEDDGMQFDGSGGRRRFGFRREVIMGDEGASLVRRTTTDDEGRFELRGAGAGEWELSASAAGCVDAEPVDVALAGGDERRDLELRLARGGAIVGTVSDDRGQPVAGADVDVRPRVNAAPAADDHELEHGFGMLFGGGPDRPRRVPTDGRGSYRVDGLAPGEYEVSLARAGGVSVGGFGFLAMEGGGERDDREVRHVKVVAGQDSRLDIVKPPAGRIEGRVLAGGQPVPDTQVSLASASAPAFLRGLAGGRGVATDAQGAFRFDDVDAGDWTLSTIVPGAAVAQEQELSLGAGETERLDLSFGGATLAGKVVDAKTGKGVPGMLLTATPVEESGEVTSEAPAFTMVLAGGGGHEGGMNMTIESGHASRVMTAADGSFEIRYLQPGTYSIAAMGGAYVETSGGPVEVVEGQALESLVLEVQRGAVLEGRVTSGSTGQPLEAVPVQLSSLDGGMQEISVTEGGRYRFDGLAAGSYTVEVLGSGFGEDAIATGEISLDAGETGTLDLETSQEV